MNNNIINLEEITVLNDIRERLSQITPEDIAACDRRMSNQNKGDKVIGMLTKDSTRALWVLASMMATACAAERVSAHQTNDEKIEASHEEQAAIYDALEDACKELFWAQAKSDTGHWKATGSIGVRRGWTLVEVSGPDEMLKGLLQRITGGPG